MRYFVLVVVTVALVAGVSAAPLVKKSLNEAGTEDQLLELLVVEKENGGVEALFKAAAQLQKKNEEREEDLENEERELELEILKNIIEKVLVKRLLGENGYGPYDARRHF
ncbi:uncharacterized protein [Amphiura filiformis]|uniref:uncharacterized protein n=1 Tax=Amphiura filiformis TaxID=82378 RepID=UPI003B218D86